MKNNEQSYLVVGIIAGFFASICCVGPLLLIAVGLGAAAGTLSALGKYENYILSGSILFFVLTTVFILQRQERFACACRGAKSKHLHIPWGPIVKSFIMMMVLYWSLTQYIVPYLMQFVR